MKTKIGVIKGYKGAREVSRLSEKVQEILKEKIKRTKKWRNLNTSKGSKTKDNKLREWKRVGKIMEEREEDQLIQEAEEILKSS